MKIRSAVSASAPTTTPAIVPTPRVRRRDPDSGGNDVGGTVLIGPIVILLPTVMVEAEGSGDLSEEDRDDGWTGETFIDDSNDVDLEVPELVPVVLA
jgi:hypothetical protein